MTPNEVAAKLQHFNDWRRGHHDEQPTQRELGEAIDAAIEMIERLEAAENRVAKLADALRSTAQTLDWMQHGKCRGFSDDLLTTNEALEKARAALDELK